MAQALNGVGAGFVEFRRHILLVFLVTGLLGLLSRLTGLALGRLGAFFLVGLRVRVLIGILGFIKAYRS